MTKRYELKYIVPHVDARQVIARIMMHPASFREAYPDRKVNNIYFDTPDFHCFHQNIEGAPMRNKMRLRWYGNPDFPNEKSVLEIKHKDKELGWKTLRLLDAGLVKSSNDLIRLVKSIGVYKSEYLPILRNSYLRSYFISNDGLFRITVDRKQRFGLPFSGNVHLEINDYPVVVEIKFDENHMERSREITDYIPFRQTKNSKYVTGVQSLYIL